MTKLIGILLIAGFSSGALANPLTRYVGTDYTCADLQNLLQEDGELNVIHRLGYGTTYADAKRCDDLPYRALPEKVYEHASDTSRCFVGYRCYILGGR